MIREQSYRRSGPLPPDRFPAVVLVKDGWNDFGRRTLYSAFVFISKTKDPVSLGMVKILQRGKISTELPKAPQKLPEEFCSLGQSVEYYTQLRELRESLRVRILTALRDICHTPAIADAFADDEGLRVSLLRESEAAALFNRARAGDTTVTGSIPSFTFTSQLPGASAPHSIDFDFNPAPLVPDRVFALIGKNGSGKTQYLRRLADAVSGTEVDESKGTFEPARPGFSTVVAVSYSAFDDFAVESARTAKGYAYCGLYNTKGRPKTRKELWRDTRADLKEIMEQNREATWRDAIASLLDDDRVARLQLAHGDEDESLKNVRELTWSLSAGELFLLAMMSRIIGFVRPTSLIILDEPEMHLHPNAIGKLVHALRLVALRFDSQVVVATHSPIVLQQIPARYVRVLRRTVGGPEVTMLQEECFGQNLTSLTESIFHSADEPPVFAQWLRGLVATHDRRRIEEAFPLGLSFTARSYLQSVDGGQ
jgi:ABC-type transport system involved in cytochrome c biogenesis ATPase subunit